MDSPAVAHRSPCPKRSFTRRGVVNGSRPQYAVTADGQRFLFDAVTTYMFEQGVTVGIHWPAMLKK